MTSSTKSTTICRARAQGMPSAPEWRCNLCRIRPPSTASSTSAAGPACRRFRSPPVHGGHRRRGQQPGRHRNAIPPGEKRRRSNSTGVMRAPTAMCSTSCSAGPDASNALCCGSGILLRSNSIGPSQIAAGYGALRHPAATKLFFLWEWLSSHDEPASP